MPQPTSISNAGEIVEQGYRQANDSVIRTLTRALKRNPGVDLGDALQTALIRYPLLRRQAEERPQKRQRKALLKETPEDDETNIALGPRQKLVHLPPASSSLPYKILEPLSPEICALFGLTSHFNQSNLTQIVLERVAVGKKIWELAGRAVFDLGEGVVVKAGDDLHPDEASSMRFLENHAPTLPAPRCMGFLTIGRRSLLFMTKIPGDTLQNRWSTLSAQAKLGIQQSLSEAISVLRNIEKPEGQPFGSLSGRCTDTRISDRYTDSPVHDEATFNQFLLTSSRSRVSNGYKGWIASMLRTNHRIVFTHGDFHPRNIMVVDSQDGGISLSGIIDWEASGFYPEYWEHLKAVNTRDTRDENDWWSHLPPAIVGYDQEIAVDCLLERSLV
ncbi:kinase-like protein [Thelephora terrestris]|uniref:Kinase-like protein n=1 Tax=Thelephora terrestris TaxID=56493 RepID=A0A9P6LDY1_9AGAM|nr:kinase-like protein [Thelephora terrestris]